MREDIKLTDLGKRVVLDFLSDYIDFGSRGHLLSAMALRDVLKNSHDEDVKRILAVKIYTEFISSLEDLGAISIAVRHRDESAGLVYAYLTYGQRKAGSPKTTLVELFKIAEKGNGLSEALCLPRLEEILRGSPDLENSMIPQLYSEVDRLLQMGSKAYLYDNRAFVRAYNKTKHGFVVVRDKHLFQPDPPNIVPETAWIIAENPQYHPDKSPELPVVEIYSVEFKHVDLMVERIRTIRGGVVSISQLVRILLDSDVITCADNRA